jgi:hypothetical protein
MLKVCEQKKTGLVYGSPRWRGFRRNGFGTEGHDSG